MRVWEDSGKSRFGLGGGIVVGANVSPKLDHAIASRNNLIVGLNVATKGAPPFSRGKQVVPGKRVVPFWPFLPSKK